MRKRYDENGKLYKIIHNMPFDKIPDDYKLKSILLDEFAHLSYVGIMKNLYSNYLLDLDITKFSEKEKEEMLDLDIKTTFDDLDYSKEILSAMALDYLKSACKLVESIMAERMSETVCSYYVVPCAYLCKHAIELKIKECLLKQEIYNFNSHNIKILWEKLKPTDIPQYKNVTNFILEVDKVDETEMVLRYGINNKLKPFSQKFQFDVVAMVENTEYLFNVLYEYC